MVRYEANADLQYKRRKLAWRLSAWNDDEVSIICFPHKLNIVLEGW